jgi:hypothetical protein
MRPEGPRKVGRPHARRDDVGKDAGNKEVLGNSYEP